MQPRLAVRERHHIGEPGEGQEGLERLPLGMLEVQQRAPVVHLAFVEGLDLPGPPPAAPDRGRARVARGTHQRVPDQPGDLVARGVPRGQGAGPQGPAQPLGMIGPAADLRGADRLIVEAHRLLTRPVGAEELGQHPAAQLGAHAALPQPDAQVDLFGPEVLRPHVAVHLIQVVAPARPAVRRGIQLGRPLGGRVGAVHDAQVDFGVRHPDRGQGDRDVGGQGLPVLWRGELVRLSGEPVVRPGVRLGEQDAVVEVAHGQA